MILLTIVSINFSNLSFLFFFRFLSIEFIIILIMLKRNGTTKYCGTNKYSGIKFLGNNK